MTQILHFTDFNVSPKTFDRWLEQDIPSRLADEAGYKPTLFVDSGGYRLLYNTHVDIEPFGFSTSVSDILRLQSKFGGHIIASLDYPLPPNIADSEAQDRIERTIANGIEVLELVSDDSEKRFLVHLAVHGRNRREARNSTTALLTEIQEKSLDDVPFGLAIGSLVPLSGSPLAVVDIVKGVIDGIQGCEWSDASTVPVHVFGVSSRMIPYLALLGVDTFDGSSYVQSARHLKYVVPGKFSNRNFLTMEEIDCECEYCLIIVQNGLREAKDVLKGQAFVEITYGGKKTNKSYVYSLIALHNLESTYVLINKLRESFTSETALSDLFREVAYDTKMRKVLAYIAREQPDVAEFLWEMGLRNLKSPAPSSHLTDGRRMRTHAKRTDQASLPSGTSPPVRLSLGPEAFDINEMDYALPSCAILLLLPCSRLKPYSRSRAHKAIAGLLSDVGVGEEDVHKVTISGNYGPVPVEFERYSAVQSYDFYLNPNDSGRKKILIDRLLTFLKAQEDRFSHVVAYCTSKAYRQVLEDTFHEFPRATLLPDPLRARRQSEFLRRENLDQLKIELKHLLSEN